MTTEALAGVKLVEKTQVVSINVAFPYEQLGAVKRLVHPPQIEIESEDYGEVVKMRLQVETPRLATLRSALADLGVRVDRSSEAGVDWRQSYSLQTVPIHLVEGGGRSL